MATVLKAQQPEVYDGQLVNVTDENKLRQGLWVYFFDTQHTKVSMSGQFVDNKKQGVWTEFYQNGNTKSTITYKDNAQNGPVKIFYEDGKLSEEGYWKINHWVGSYKYYHHSNGQLAYDWLFDEEGRRTGEQKYYYENGSIRIAGYWQNGLQNGQYQEYYDSGKLRAESQWKFGKTDGVVKEYYENGTLKAERVFNNGIYDPDASKIYDKTKPVKEQKPIQQPENQLAENDDKTSPSQEQDKQNTTIVVASFTGTGFHKLYNSNKQLEREGEFINGIFISGKRYYYNTQGDLIKTAIYKNGRIVEVIEKQRQ